MTVEHKILPSKNKLGVSTEHGQCNGPRRRAVWAVEREVAGAAQGGLCGQDKEAGFLFQGDGKPLDGSKQG